MSRRSWTALGASTLLLVLQLGSPPAVVAAPPETGSTAASLAVDRELSRFAAWVAEQGGELSASFVRGETVLAEHDSRRALNPASNVKLVTAAAALSELGPAYRFTTAVHGRLDQGRAAHLVLRGDGDPSLEAQDIEQLARELANLGVEQVGDVLVDQSYFDEQFVPPGFEQQPNEWAAFRAPVSAIALAKNAVTVSIRPTRRGQPARVWVEPRGGVELEARVQTRAPGRGQALRLSVSGRRVSLSGHVAEGLPAIRLRRRMDDPRLVPGFALRAALQRHGVAMEGTVRAGVASDEPVLVDHRSGALAVLVRHLGKDSDNFYAEMLLKALGAQQAKPGRSEAGARVLMRFLADRGVSGPGLSLRNGSGLFDGGRLSADALARLLASVAADARVAPEFMSQLALGGVDGTLRSRFRTQAKERRIRAKTGTLARVIALSGYVQGAPGSVPIAFSLLVNGVRAPHAETRKRLDAVVDAAATVR